MFYAAMSIIIVGMILKLRWIVDHGIPPTNMRYDNGVCLNFLSESLPADNDPSSSAHREPIDLDCLCPHQSD